jgi:hypothetical protein
MQNGINMSKKEIKIETRFNDITNVTLKHKYDIQKMYKESDHSYTVRFNEFDYIKDICINGCYDTEEEEKLYNDYNDSFYEQYPTPNQGMDYTISIGDKTEEL